MLNMHDENNISTQPVDEFKGKSKKKRIFIKVLIGFVLALTLFGGITVLGYYTFLPAKHTLMTSGYVSTLKSYNYIDKNISLYEKKYINPLMKSTIKNESQVGLSLDKKVLEQFLPAEYAEKIISVLNNLAIKYDYAIDLNNKKSTEKLGLSYLLNPILTFRMSIDDSRFAVGVDELSNKAITGEIKGLGKLSEFLPNTPPEFWDIIANTDPWVLPRIIDEVKIDKDELKTLIFDYSKEIINSIDSGDMSIKRGKTTDVLGKDIKCQEVTIKLDVEAQKKIALNCINKMKNDDSFYNITFGNLTKYFDILFDNPYYKQIAEESGIIDILSKDNFVAELSKAEEKIKKADFSEDLKVNVYINGLDVVKYVISSDEASHDSAIIIERDIKDLSFNSKLAFFSDAGDNYIKTLLIVKREHDKKNDVNDVTMELSAEHGAADDISKYSVLIESDEEISSKNEVDHAISAIIKAEAADFAETDNVTFSISLNGTKTKNNNNLITERDYRGNFSVKITDLMPSPIKMGFYAKTDTIYGEEVSIPEYSQVLDIKSATQEDFNQLISEIENNLSSLLQLASGF